MTERFLYSAVLRQLPSVEHRQPSLCCRLSMTELVRIGRDPRCQVVLDTRSYAGVSRWHVEIRPAADWQLDEIPTWWICDLNSANGTYINGQRLHGCQILCPGDRITLSQNGPEFVFECQMLGTAAFAQTAPPTSPNPAMAVSPQPSADPVTVSQLFPILSTGQDLHRKAYLLPAAITIVVVVSLFASVGNPLVFNLLLAGYLAIAAYYWIYQLCGKRKPWWVLLCAALLTMLLLQSPVTQAFTVIFREVLPGRVTSTPPIDNFPLLLIQMFFGAGLMEELIKAIPVLLAYWLGLCLRSPWRERIGVREPLDGILLGTASAVGFTLIETLGQYVPEISQTMTVEAGDIAGELAGLQLLIPRILGIVAGHMAYSGYFGYFIGLSVLKPGKRWLILGIGYLNAAGLHALWNTSGSLSVLLLAAVGVISYAFLGAAILKARALSPTRSQNFATRFYE
jgi:RsiW-degrading membrane proteinase PrsW (M82 family)